MKYIKRFTQFNEGAFVTAAVGGMGDVIASQPGAVPGTTGTTGSGDIPVVLKTRPRRKKGNPSQVCDARDLAPVKINRVKN